MRLATAPTAEPAEIVLDLDAGHWARQGRVAFEIDLTDGIIGSSDLIAGFMHRGAEKLFEVRDYRQGMALANRHDWLAPVGGEILLARAAEELLGMPVPRQGRLLRLLLLELSRAASMLAFLGPAAAPTGMPAADELRSKAAAAREELLELLELLTGARMHVTFSVVVAYATTRLTSGLRPSSAPASGCSRKSRRRLLTRLPPTRSPPCVPASVSCRVNQPSATAPPGLSAGPAESHSISARTIPTTQRFSISCLTPRRLPAMRQLDSSGWPPNSGLPSRCQPSSHRG